MASVIYVAAFAPGKRAGAYNHYACPGCPATTSSYQSVMLLAVRARHAQKLVPEGAARILHVAGCGIWVGLLVNRLSLVLVF